MKSDTRLYLKCSCGCSAFEMEKLSFDDNEEIYCFSIWKPCFYTYQGNILQVFWDRIKTALTIIFKGEYYLYDIILEKDDMIELGKYIGGIK